MLVCLLVFPDTKAEDKNQAEVLLGATDRRLMQADPGSFSDNECQDNGSCSPSYKEKSLLRPQVTARSQGLSLPFWDPDSPTTNQYLISDSPNVLYPTAQTIDSLMQLDLSAGVDVEVKLWYHCMSKVMFLSSVVVSLISLFMGADILSSHILDFL